MVEGCGGQAGQQYRVQVRSRLDPGWLEDYPLVTSSTAHDQDRRPMTTLVLQVIDQAHLMGILNEIHGMGALLISVERLDRV